MSTGIDRFTNEFKRYKARQPAPDLANVIDFDQAQDPQVINPAISEVSLGDRTCRGGVHGLIPSSQWRCFTLRRHPGFLYIRNPFTARRQEYWIKRCVRDYPRCHKTNLPAEIQLDRLRWVTMGYHYDWTRKVYPETQGSPVPRELADLSRHIADVIGYPLYSPEAVIVNYYHPHSTLAGHTDRSEVDLSSPIISLSFGQSAVFLLGGTTKKDEPSAMYLRSGDIAVLGGECRLAYHALPRLIQSPSSSRRWTDASRRPAEETLPDDSNFTVDRNDVDERAVDVELHVPHAGTTLVQDTENADILEYVERNRINVSIRQVHPHRGANEVHPRIDACQT